MLKFQLGTLCLIICHQTQTSTEFSVPLNPPPIATPTISYSSTGGRSGSTSSDSPYVLTDTVRNDIYTFTVSVTNVAGVSSALSNEVTSKLFGNLHSTLYFIW